MTYNSINPRDIEYFQNLIQEQFVLTKKDHLEKYAKDHTEDLKFFPEVVLLPANTFEIAQILKYCNTHQISVTPRGAGTGLSGGALAVHGGIVLSLERLNAILIIDSKNFQATVEPGVINETLQQEVIKFGMFYPPDPASKGSCFLGGNVAHASGGPRALKYGTTRDYVLNLEVVLPSGEIIWTGANTLKYSSGYNLTHLMIGSEGTLGIVTKIVLKLIPYPTQNALLLASFTSATAACNAVAAIFMAGCTPSVCEFMEREALQLSATFTGLPFQIPQEVQAYLLLEIDGNDMAAILVECEKVHEVLSCNLSVEVLLADNAEQKGYLWKLRRCIGEATKHNNVYKEEDTVVPRGELAVLYAGVKEIARRYHLRTICYGHAGDGNLHINILKDNHTDAYWNHEVKQAIKEIFERTISLKGTISGEHGIGLVQKEYLPIALSEIHLDLMRKIKLAFDPNLILNPGKIF
jgi:glycolate oxidase